jgi:Fur family ferric uptake transcriptional regulator
MATLSDDELQKVRDGWADFLRSSDLRLTEPRRVIFEAALRVESPFTADELWDEARKEDKLISLATIYRNLPLLVKGKVLHKADIEGEKQHYANSASNGSQLFLVCADCQKHIPLEDDCLRLRQLYVAKQMGFNPEHISLRIDGSCKDIVDHGPGHCHRDDEEVNGQPEKLS